MAPKNYKINRRRDNSTNIQKCWFPSFETHRNDYFVNQCHKWVPSHASNDTLDFYLVKIMIILPSNLTERGLSIPIIFLTVSIYSLYPYSIQFQLKFYRSFSTLEHKIKTWNVFRMELKSPDKKRTKVNSSDFSFIFNLFISFCMYPKMKNTEEYTFIFNFNRKHQTSICISP